MKKKAIKKVLLVLLAICIAGAILYGINLIVIFNDFKKNTVENPLEYCCSMSEIQADDFRFYSKSEELSPFSFAVAANGDADKQELFVFSEAVCKPFNVKRYTPIYQSTKMQSDDLIAQKVGSYLFTIPSEENNQGKVVMVFYSKNQNDISKISCEISGQKDDKFVEIKETGNIPAEQAFVVFSSLLNSTEHLDKADFYNSDDEIIYSINHNK